MISENPTLAEVIRHAIDARFAELFKALPGIVTSYDPLTSTCFVKPAVAHSRYSRETGGRSYVEMGEIPFVPVAFPRAGDMVLRMPLKPGDSVLLVFSDVSTVEFRASASASEPEDARHHGCGYPIAIPGFFPDCKPMSALDAPEIVAGGMLVGKDGGSSDERLVFGGLPNGNHVATIEAVALLLHNVLVAMCTPGIGEVGMLVGGALAPKIAAIINAAIAASAVPAPPGLPAQAAAAVAMTAAMTAGGPGSTVAPYAASLAALSSKTPNESGLFPSLGAKSVKTG